MLSNSSSIALLVLIATIFAVSASEQSSQSDLYENAETKDDIAAHKRPFFVGSRYGRSQGLYESKARRVNVAPRSDRFFLGSRYGKRGNEYVPASASLFEQDSGNQSNFFTMSCSYTGFKDYFRCSATKDTSNFIQHIISHSDESENNN